LALVIAWTQRRLDAFKSSSLTKILIPPAFNVTFRLTLVSTQRIAFKKLQGAARNVIPHRRNFVEISKNLIRERYKSEI